MSKSYNWFFEIFEKKYEGPILYSRKTTIESALYSVWNMADIRDETFSDDDEDNQLEVYMYLQMLS